MDVPPDGPSLVIGVEVVLIARPAEVPSLAALGALFERGATDASADRSPLRHAPLHVGVVLAARTTPLAEGPRETAADPRPRLVEAVLWALRLDTSVLPLVPPTAAESGTARADAVAGALLPDVPLSEAPRGARPATRLHALGTQSGRVTLTAEALAVQLLLPLAEILVIVTAVLG